MQSVYPPVFEREMGCTEAEWCGWLPAALGEHGLPGAVAAPQACAMVVPEGSVPAREAAAALGSTLVVGVGAGTLRLTWLPLQPRRLGLAVLPRLWVRFEFDQVPDAQRHAFMKRFDLYTQRGGG